MKTIIACDKFIHLKKLLCETFLVWWISSVIVLIYLHGSERIGRRVPFVKKFLNYLHGSELIRPGVICKTNFLNYLHGSEHLRSTLHWQIEFLNYLHGSEQDLKKRSTQHYFLNYLHGSEQNGRLWDRFVSFSKLPTRQWTRTRYTINVVGKKAKSIFTKKNPFFEPFFNLLIF